MTLARTERAGLAADLSRLGPDAPTLCEGWTARDLLSHVLLRENDPLAVPGMAWDLFDDVTASRQARLEDSASFPELVARFAAGPKPWSVFRFPGMDRAANSMEYFIHHEDLLRAQPGWTRRDLGHATQTGLARIVSRSGRLLLRRSPVGVRAELTGMDGDLAKLTLRPGQRIVTVVGAPSEVLLHMAGRKEVADVEVLGEKDAVEAFVDTDCGL